VSTFGAVLDALLFLFLILLIARIVMETVFMFARSYEPKGIALVLLEIVFSVTDPPVKALRRLIPPLRLGQISLDLSVIVLFVLIYVLRAIAQQL
jgi:YggT family protein